MKSNKEKGYFESETNIEQTFHHFYHREHSLVIYDSVQRAEVVLIPWSAIQNDSSSTLRLWGTLS